MVDCFARCRVANPNERRDRVTTFLAVLGCMMLLGGSASGQKPDAEGQKPDPVPAASLDAVRAETLDWLDAFVTGSALMSKEDVQKIRASVAGMSPSQLESWLAATTELRAYIESRTWQDTKRWLREFLRVQNIYSEAEIEQFRTDVRNADAQQMLVFLKKIQEKHDSLTWLRQASERDRAAGLAGRAAQAPATGRSSAASSGASRPLFGSAQGQAASRYKSSKGYRVPGPVIDSRTVAQEAVRREAFGGAYGW